MINLSKSAKAEQAGKKPMRFVTATSLFDGHDASINIMRRVLQDRGAEVIHLGHDRPVDDIVRAAVHEDADAIAVSSYQGGHMEFFSYMLKKLKEYQANIHIFGGGGGTITDKEIQALQSLGVKKIFSVEDGRQLGLEGMIDYMLEHGQRKRSSVKKTNELGFAQLARAITLQEKLKGEEGQQLSPVLGITGTGGSGKSSLTDELLRRFLELYPDDQFAVVSIDPSRRRSGGALLGDRLRMNSLASDRVFMRSIATGRANVSLPDNFGVVLDHLKGGPFKLVIVETAGIGQSDSEITEFADLCVYVMTPEFGAPSQLEKIDMLDYADFIALNKSDRQSAKDALAHIAKQFQRNRKLFDLKIDDMPVVGCQANRFGDKGVDELFTRIIKHLSVEFSWPKAAVLPDRQLDLPTLILPDRKHYLLDIAKAVRSYHQETKENADRLADIQAIRRAQKQLAENSEALDERLLELSRQLPEVVREIAEEDSFLGEEYLEAQNSYVVRGKQIVTENYTESLSGSKIPRVSPPRFNDASQKYKWLRNENFPGSFPFTAGVFPYKRIEEETARMFAGEGSPERTNRRFHLLSQGQRAVRLSTAFDSVTLYGRDPDSRPDIYGKIGNSGVSVATLLDAQKLYSGFDLADPATSVSMTINGPAPSILAMFLNTAIDQAVEKHLRSESTLPEPHSEFAYKGDLPSGHNGLGLALLGYNSKDLVSAETFEKIKNETLKNLRGTVQADILKEDQSQNTCIFSTDFSLKMMGDIQEYFIEKSMNSFYSVSISGYHIAEAGANPITQLAFTLANGFTYMEHYLARGMNPDNYARNLSFFFSNGLDPEYVVIGRVARRIWAIALKNYYGASERSQKLKYHVQTSGRSLHAQEIQFNDIRTTLQALLAISDHCNSLHTNAFDEAITTPTEESVRRALAIQLIVNQEFGFNKCENPWQGSFYIDYLTDMVERAVLQEFERINERGGVLGAMETMYQRFKIQEESMLYETKKHNGEIPIVGVNTFLGKNKSNGSIVEVDLIRATDNEKQQQIENLNAFQKLNEGKSDHALEKLKAVARRGGNVFEELMETVRYCSLGQISNAFFDCGGAYRRSM